MGHDDQDIEFREEEHVQGLIAQLDELLVVVEKARSVPMSASILVNRDEMVGMLERVRAAVPFEVDEANILLADSDSVLARAKSEARKIVEESRGEAARLVAKEAIVVTARENAEQLVAEASAEKERLIAEADDYCDRRLADFQIDLERLLNQVNKGRDKLAQRLGGDSSGVR